jgi:GLPGLI family protein
MNKSALNRILAFVLFSLSIVSAKAQKQLSEGVVSYAISIDSDKDNSLASGLDGATLDLYVKPNVSRTEMTSKLGTETTVYDTRNNKGFILKEYSGQKLMITVTRENWLQKNNWNDQIKFTIENEVKEIAGYQCRKATGKNPDGKEFTVYFTPDVVLSNTTYNNSFAQLPGLPVQYELKSGNLKFKYTLSKISFDPVVSSKFDAPKSGFRMMTYEENQQLKKVEKK